MSNVNIIVDLIDNTSPIEVISLDDEPLQINNISKENKLFFELVEKCLNFEDSKGMNRVLNKMVIPAYKELDENYIKSQSFKKTLIKTLQQVEIDPLHKFSHVRDLYETLKLHKIRKKVNFVTLATNIKETSTSVITKRKTDEIQNLFKKPKVDIINLADDNPPIINLDNYEYDVVLLDEERTHLVDDKENNESDSYNSSLDISKRNISLPSKCDKDNNLVTYLNENKEIQEPKHNDINAEKSDDEGSTFLIPKTVEIFREESGLTVSEKVLEIEKEIAWYKNKIAILEEIEVDYDTMTSPYIECEKCKAKIVALYKELCELTGIDAVKRREVRLKVNDGHPSGPVERLERFLNNNIGSDGDPPFPDFHDVVKCVVISNNEDGLGWSKTQIMREATILFTQCGRALQQRRQKREWRHLMCRVKREQCDTDPADDDPELEAKLQENKRIALKKEADILECFSIMQYSTLNQIETNVGETNAILERNNNSGSGSDTETETTELNNKETSEIYSEETSQHRETNLSKENNFINEDEVKIKKEPVEDVVKLLEGLGDNFTTTIKDIEDPFLIIEISSDSSSDEE